MKLIDADELEYMQIGTNAYVRAEDILLAKPVDAVPVRHGHWIDIDTETYTWKIRCSRCGHERSMMSTGKTYPMWCENCGARMDGDE